MGLQNMPSPAGFCLPGHMTVAGRAVPQASQVGWFLALMGTLPMLVKLCPPSKGEETIRHITLRGQNCIRLLSTQKPYKGTLPEMGVSFFPKVRP